MKTVVCDICGKSKEQLDLNNKAIYHFKRTVTWGCVKSEPKEIDICRKCLEAIKEARRKGGEADET